MQPIESKTVPKLPFRVSVDAGEIVAHRAWQAARERVLAQLARGPGGVAVLGPAGCGKTLLLREIARTLSAQGQRTRSFDRGEFPADFFASPAETVLVDEADRMTQASVQDLVGAPGASLVLAALPGFAERLGPDCAVVQLGPLPLEEVARFVACRLATAGQRRDLLAPDAIVVVAEHSGGVPRMLNVLAGSAVFLATMEGDGQVTARHIEHAVLLREGETGRESGAGEGSAAEPEKVASAPAPSARTARPESPLVVGPRAPARRGRAAWVRKLTTRGVARPVLAACVVGLIGAVVAIGLQRRPVPNPAPAAPASEPSHATGAGPPPATVPPAAAPPAAPAPVVPAPVVPAPVVPAPVVPAPVVLAPVVLAPVVPAPVVPAPVARPPPVLAPGPDVPAVLPIPPPVPLAHDAPTSMAARVVIQVRAESQPQAQALAVKLASAYGEVEIRRVGSMPREPMIRYFYAEDLAPALVLENALRGTGLDWQIKNFTTYRPKPRRGTVEIWLP